MSVHPLSPEHKQRAARKFYIAQSRENRACEQASFFFFPVTLLSPHARENSNETLVPPKPKELLITASKSPVTLCSILTCVIVVVVTHQNPPPQPKTNCAPSNRKRARGGENRTEVRGVSENKVLAQRKARNAYVATSWRHKGSNVSATSKGGRWLGSFDFRPATHTRRVHNTESTTPSGSPGHP